MKKSRRTVQIVILFLIVILGGYAISSSVMSSSTDRVKQGDKAPSFSLLGVDGTVHDWEEYKGKPVVLNFWGTWCTPCVKEMPALQAQWEKWSEQGVMIVGINAGEDQMTVHNFMKQTGVDFPVLLDKKSDAVRKYGVVPLPTTFFIGSNGRITSIHLGELDLTTLDNQISKLVNP